MQADIVNTIEIAVLAIIVLLVRKLIYPPKMRLFLWGIVGMRAILPSGMIDRILSLNLNMSSNTLGTVLNRVPINLFTIARYVGIIGVFAFWIFDQLRIGKLEKTSTEIEPGVFKAESIPTAFTAGLFKPKFFIPSKASTEEVEYMLIHERTHVKRHDCLWKQAGILILAINWYNPFLWLAYDSMCTDMEQACDDDALQETDRDYRKAYAKALVRYSIQKNRIGTHVRFSTKGIKDRISNILKQRKIKKSDYIIFTAAIISVIVIAITGLTINRDKMNSTDRNIPGLDTEESTDYFIQNGGSTESIVIEYMK